MNASFPYSVQINEFFHVVNSAELFGIPIDNFLHILVCLHLYLFFHLVFQLRPRWCFLLIFVIGMVKVFLGWHAMILNGRYENPELKMLDNGIGAVLGYYFSRRLKRTRPSEYTPDL